MGMIIEVIYGNGVVKMIIIVMTWGVGHTFNINNTKESTIIIIIAIMIMIIIIVVVVAGGICWKLKPCCIITEREMRSISSHEQYIHLEYSLIKENRGEGLGKEMGRDGLGLHGDATT